MHLTVLQCADMGVSHTLLHALTWSLESGSWGAEEEGPRRCCVGKGSLAERGKGQPPRSELWVCEATGAHVDECRLGVLLAAPVGTGMWPPRRCRCGCPELWAPRSSGSNACCRCSVHLNHARWTGQCSHGTCHVAEILCSSSLEWLAICLPGRAFNM